MTDDSLSSVRGDVWLGDVVHCWRTLHAESDEQRAQIAQILGFQMTLAAPSRRPLEARAPGPKLDIRPRPPEPGFDPDRAPGPAEPTPPDSLRPIPLQARAIVSVGREQTPRWRLEPVPLDGETTAHLGFEPRFDPLFDSRWTRAMVSAFCAVLTRDGAVDVPTLVDRLARFQPITELPVRRRPTLRLGIQLLIDEGQSMMPFRRDVRDLALRIRQVVGADRAPEISFIDHPLRVDEEDPNSRPSYRPPPAGTPVVVLSDFGLSRGARLRGGARVSEWIRLASSLRSSGSTMIGVLPLPRARWPRELAKAIQLIVWDRKTAVAEARRLTSREPMT